MSGAQRQQHVKESGEKAGTGMSRQSRAKLAAPKEDSDVKRLGYCQAGEQSQS